MDSSEALSATVCAAFWRANWNRRGVMLRFFGLVFLLVLVQLPCLTQITQMLPPYKMLEYTARARKLGWLGHFYETVAVKSAQ